MEEAGKVGDTTRSSSNTEPQQLLDSGPMLLRDFNPKGVLRFSGRKCLTCGGEIMDHWLRPNDNPDLRAEYWCSKDGDTFSQGIADGVWDVPVATGITIEEQENDAIRDQEEKA